MQVLVSLCLCVNPTDATNFLTPTVNLAENRARTLQQLAVNADLQGYRWDTLHTDMPALNPARLAPTDQYIGLAAWTTLAGPKLPLAETIGPHLPHPFQYMHPFAGTSTSCHKFPHSTI